MSALGGLPRRYEKRGAPEGSRTGFSAEGLMGRRPTLYGAGWPLASIEGRTCRVVVQAGLRTYEYAGFSVPDPSR
jgi:hypothetical protein